MIQKFLIERTKRVFEAGELWVGAAVGILAILPDVSPEMRFADYTLFLWCIGMFAWIGWKNHKKEKSSD